MLLTFQFIFPSLQAIEINSMNMNILRYFMIVVFAATISLITPLKSAPGYEMDDDPENPERGTINALTCYPAEIADLIFS